MMWSGLNHHHVLYSFRGNKTQLQSLYQTSIMQYLNHQRVIEITIAHIRIQCPPYILLMYKANNITDNLLLQNVTQEASPQSYITIHVPIRLERVLFRFMYNKSFLICAFAFIIRSRHVIKAQGLPLFNANILQKRFFVYANVRSKRYST